MAATRYNLLLALAALSACKEEHQSAAQQDLPVSACHERQFEGSAFTLCEYDAADHRLELFVEGKDRQPLRDFEALEGHLGERASRLLFAMNAGMYDDEGRPIGLYIEAGKKLHSINLRDGPGNFHLKPNGVLAVDASGRVSVTASDKFEEKNVQWATQSGPMLVLNGKPHPKIDPDGESLNVRNGVAACGSTTAWFAISEEPVSFGRFARLFRDELKCPNALFLDGSVSSLWEAGVRRDNRAPLGPIIAVFRK